MLQTLLAIGVPAAGASFGFARWLVRLESRQNSHERECMQRQKNADERHVNIQNTLAHMDAKLDRLVEGQ